MKGNLMDFSYPTNFGRDLNFWKSVRNKDKFKTTEEESTQSFLVAVAQARMILCRGNNEKLNTVLIL